MQTRTHHLLKQAAALYPFDMGTVRLIRSSNQSPNDIYDFTKDGKRYILRIATHTESHTHKTVGEMEWLAFLHVRGVPVSMPLPMRDGRMVALLVSAELYHDVCAFEKAEGVHIDRNDPRRWNPEIAEDWGYTMGRMHRETKAFRDIRDARGVFDGSDGPNDSLERVPEIQAYARALVARLLALPCTPDTYGLIHCDFHQNNFFVHNNKVHVFDFDDSMYGYFALDIGIALHHALIWGLPHDAVEKRQAEAERVVARFMEGYRRANVLDAQACGSILWFMRYRQLCNFGWEYREDNPMVEEQRNLLEGFEVEGCRLTEGVFA